METFWKISVKNYALGKNQKTLEEISDLENIQHRMNN